MPHITINDLIRENTTIYVNCAHPHCSRSARVDLPALAAKIGGQHGAMHDDLAGHFRCDACRAAGRGYHPPFFTVIPDYAALHRRYSGGRA